LESFSRFKQDSKYKAGLVSSNSLNLSARFSFFQRAFVVPSHQASSAVRNWSEAFTRTTASPAVRLGHDHDDRLPSQFRFADHVGSPVPADAVTGKGTLQISGYPTYQELGYVRDFEHRGRRVPSRNMA
jgi:hypothetical protein